MKPLRLLILLSAFCLDVQVHADRVHYSENKRETIQVSEGTRLILDRGAIVERREDVLHVVQGLVYLDANDAVTLQTPFNLMTCESSCRALIERKRGEVEIKNLHGRVLIRRTGEDRTLALPAGMRLKISRVNSKGVAELEFPQSLPWADTVRTWARLFPGDVKEFRSTLIEFRKDWLEAVEAATLLHQDYAGRALASFEAERKKARERREARLKEEAELRRLFRQKNYLEQ